MKIHEVANPPAGLTALPLEVDQVEITERGCVKVRFRVPNGPVVLTLPLDYSSLSELPAPGDAVNVSLWRVP